MESTLASGILPQTDYQLKTLAQLFPKLNVASAGSYNPLVITSVQLPNSTQYTFSYNNHAEVASITLPTGGKVQYIYGPGNPVSQVSGENGEFGYGVYVSAPTFIAGFSAIYRRIVARHTYAGAGLEGTTVYSTALGTDETKCPGVLGNASLTVTVKHLNASSAPLAEERHSFCGNPGDINSLAEFDVEMPFSRWREGREYLTEFRSIDGTTVKRKSADDWQQRASVSWWVESPGVPGVRGPRSAADEPARDPRVSQTDQTVDGGKISRETYSYDQYTNRTQTIFYNFGTSGPGAQLKRIRTTFLTTASYVADTRHLVSLPETEEVFDETDTLAGKTVYEYDSYPEQPTARSGILQHDPAYGGTFSIRGNVTATRRYYGASDYVRTRQEYDIAGNVVKSYNGRGKTTTRDFAFDPAGCSLPPGAFGFATKVTDPLSRAIEICYDSYIGKPTKIVAPVGPITNKDETKVTTTFDYTDPLDRLKRVTKASGAPEATRTSFTYVDTPGAASVTIEGDLAAAEDGKLKTQAVYDGLGRVKASRLYETASSYTTTEQTYDGLGRPSQKSNPYRSDETPIYTSTTYDALGRVESVSLPGGAVEQYDYVGDRTNYSDPGGKKLVTYSDALGRLLTVIEDPCPNDVTGHPATQCLSNLNYSTSYTYDGLDNLTKVTQQTQVRQFAYDWLKRLVKAENPESGMTCYGARVGADCRAMYDGNGNLTRKTDARLVVTDYSWDDIDRPLTRTFSDATPAVTWTWDTLQVGSLTSISNSASVTSYSDYDRLGRPRASRQTTSGVDYDFSYVYDRAGHVKEIVYPGSRRVAYDFDDAGRISAITGQKDSVTTAYASEIQYAAHQDLSRLTFGTTAARVEQRCYNSRLQAVVIRVRPTLKTCDVVGQAADSSDLVHLAVGFGSGSTNNGNVISQAIWPLNKDQNYSYDGVNRLSAASEAGGFSRTYGYDAYGNRWVSTSSGLVNGIGNELTGASQINAPNNRIAPGDTTNYDDAGNLKVYAPYNVDYDAENRMIRMASTANGSMTLAYDGDGRRVRKVWSAGGVDVTTVYVYDAAGELAQEYQTGGTVEASGTTYLANDWLGSARLTMDRAGEVRQRHDYLPFGRLLHAGENGRTVGNGYLAVPVGTSGRPTMRRMFTGKERDWETDSPLDYFGARYFSGAQGRFTSPDNPFADQDPLDPQRWNLYSYTRNNPLKYVDRNGEAIETAWDALNIGLGVKSFVDNVRSGNYLSATVDAVGVVVDSAAAAVPFIPGGAGTLIKAGRLAGKADDIVGGVKALNHADDAADAGKTTLNLAEGTVGELRKAGKSDAHHVIQDAAVRDLPGYNSSKAPGVQLPGPPSKPGTPHNSTRAVQQQRGGGTYAAERRIGYKALRKAGATRDQARQQIKRADEYFDSIGVAGDTGTRIPRDRR
ncbi:MAG: RHS repeat-associated core domain-containing protein [Bryobacterales bacterium]|nr:RHS repeat-associated core domain-containing protein [Bryobacterales bacterium]